MQNHSFSWILLRFIKRFEMKGKMDKCRIFKLSTVKLIQYNAERSVLPCVAEQDEEKY